MPTIIDSLIMELGLDSSKFTQSQAEAVAAAKAAQDQLKRAGDEQEKSAKSIQDAFSKAQQHALEFFATILGAHGLKELVTDLTTTDAALGRLAANIGMSPQILSSWQMAAERMGGSADATANSLTRTAQALYDLHRNGQMLPIEFSQLQARAGMAIDPDHGVGKFMTDIAAAAHKLSQTDMTQAHFLLSGLGIDDATANAMIKYGDGFDKYLQSISKYAPSKQTIENMQALQDSWFTLQQSATSLANSLLGDLEPVLEPILNQLTAWIDANHQWISQEVLSGVQQLIAYLKSVDWKEIGDGLMVIANAILSAIGAVASVKGVDSRKLNGIDPTENTYWSFQDSQKALNESLRGPVSDQIRTAARANGIDPDYLMTNYGAEGMANYVGDDGSSYGPFQLHYGGLSSKFPGKGLGDEFTKATGLDARDPSTVNDQINWYAKYVAKNGWGASMGMGKLGIHGMEGIAPNAVALGAASSANMMKWAGLSNVQNNHPVTTSSSSVAMHVDKMDIHAGGGSADEIAKNITPAMRRRIMAWAANTAPL